MKIKLEYMDLTIIIEATTIETASHAIIAGASVLKTLQELGYGNPKVEMKLEDLKDVPK
jgi:hypothetical protein